MLPAREFSSSTRQKDGVVDQDRGRLESQDARSRGLVEIARSPAIDLASGNPDRRPRHQFLRRRRSDILLPKPQRIGSCRKERFGIGKIGQERQNTDTIAEQGPRRLRLLGRAQAEPDILRPCSILQYAMHCPQHRIAGQLHIDDIALAELADRFGTPLYAYSRRAMLAALAPYQRALAGRDYLICYAMKANSNLAVLQTFAQAGLPRLNAPDDLAETPRRVGDAFGLIVGKIDGWIHDFLLLLPNLVVGLFVALLFLGVTIPTVLYILWGVMELTQVPVAR